jgi:hypothetical protein
MSSICECQSLDQLNTQNQSKISIYCTILEAQMTKQEAAHAAMVLKRLTSKPLYAYKYKQPIHAVDPLRPTQLEVDRSRYIVLLTSRVTESNHPIQQPERFNVHPFAHQ